MRKIIVLGNSVAGVAAIEEFRKNDPDSEITIFSFEDNLPYQRHLFGDFLAKDISEEGVFYRPNDFYRQNKISFVTGKKLVRVDFKKNRLVCEDKEYFGFDVLILADSPALRSPDIKGDNKEGVFSFKRLEDMKKTLKLLPLIDSVVIQSNDLTGLKAAYGFAQRQKEVVVVVPGPHLLPALLDEESSFALEKICEAKGIRFIHDSTIIQIHGDNDVKAIKLKSEKVIACQAVILDGASPDLRFLAETPLDIPEGIFVDEWYRTSIENVFAVDKICTARAKQCGSDFLYSAMWLGEQGRRVSASLAGQTWNEPAEVPEMRWKLFDTDICLLGKLCAQQAAQSLGHGDEKAQTHKKLFIIDNTISGAVFINDLTQVEQIRRLIQEKTPVIGAGQDILQNPKALPPGENAPPAGVSISQDQGVGP